MKNEAAVSLGKLGGVATASKHGKKHFSEAGKKGNATRWGFKDIQKLKTCKHGFYIGLGACKFGCS